MGVDPILFAQIFALSYMAIGLRAFQQINVTMDYRKMILPTSMALSLFEISAYGATILNGMGGYILANGIGAGLGSLTSMHIQSRLKERGFYASR